MASILLRHIYKEYFHSKKEAEQIAAHEALKKAQNSL